MQIDTSRCFFPVWHHYADHIFTTKYIITESSLAIYSGIRKYVIPYEKVSQIEKRTINQGFRHGAVNGRIRAETNSEVFLITFTDPEYRTRVIMISPAEQDLFARHMISMIRKAGRQ